MLITFSGLDGAGKSTLIQRCKAIVENEGRRVSVRTMYFHCSCYAHIRRLRDRLYFWKAPRKKGAPSPHHIIPNLGRPDVSDQSTWIARCVYGCFRSRFVRRVALFGDLVLFFFCRLWEEGVRGRVLITDRYFYDSLADVVSQEKIRWRFVRFFLACCPMPDLPIFVDVPPEVAFERKKEYSIDYLRWRRGVYQTIFAQVRDPLICTNNDLEQTLTLCKTETLQRMACAS